MYVAEKWSLEEILKRKKKLLKYIYSLTQISPPRVNRVSTACQPCVNRVSTVCQPCVNRVSTACQPCVNRVSTVCELCVNRVSTVWLQLHHIPVNIRRKRRRRSRYGLRPKPKASKGLMSCVACVQTATRHHYFLQPP
jgi:hypothetical protein